MKETDSDTATSSSLDSIIDKDGVERIEDNRAIVKTEDDTERQAEQDTADDTDGSSSVVIRAEVSTCDGYTHETKLEAETEAEIAERFMRWYAAVASDDTLAELIDEIGES